MMNPDRLAPADEALERALRPKKLADYVGQTSLKNQLELFITAARSRGEALDHVLLFGPPGLGKTTLAAIIASEMGAALKQSSGPVLERAGDLAAILTNLSSGDVLFIDEIHRLPAAVEELLYPAMEDFQLDIVIGEGPAARSVKLDLPPFTLIGATTRTGLLSAPLRARFGISQGLGFYSAEELGAIVARSAQLLGVPCDAAGALAIGQRARGTPRLANRLLRRVRDFVEVRAEGRIEHSTAAAALQLLGMDEVGLDALDRRFLQVLGVDFAGGPVGIDTLAARLGEERSTLEDMVEPYLIQQGFVQRSARGRLATAKTHAYLREKS